MEQVELDNGIKPGDRIVDYRSARRRVHKARTGLKRSDAGRGFYYETECSQWLYQREQDPLPIRKAGAVGRECKRCFFGMGAGGRVAPR